MAHVRVWKFLPPEGREQEFAKAYGSHGVWAELFSKGAGYRGTQLLRPEAAVGWWLTLDRWESASDFDAFQRQFGDEYGSLDTELAGLAGQEDFVGAFED